MHRGEHRPSPPRGDLRRHEQRSPGYEVVASGYMRVGTEPKEERWLLALTSVPDPCIPHSCRRLPCFRTPLTCGGSVKEVSPLVTMVVRAGTGCGVDSCRRQSHQRWSGDPATPVCCEEGTEGQSDEMGMSKEGGRIPGFLSNRQELGCDSPETHPSLVWYYPKLPSA